MNDQNELEDRIDELKNQIIQQKNELSDRELTTLQALLDAAKYEFNNQ